MLRERERERDQLPLKINDNARLETTSSDNACGRHEIPRATVGQVKRHRYR